MWMYLQSEFNLFGSHIFLWMHKLLKHPCKLLHRDAFHCCWTGAAPAVAHWLHRHSVPPHWFYWGILPAINILGQRTHRKMHQLKTKSLAAANTWIHFSLSSPFSLKEKMKKMKTFNQQAVKILGKSLSVSAQFNSSPMYQGSTLTTVLLAVLERETNTYVSHTPTYAFYPEGIFPGIRILKLSWKKLWISSGKGSQPVQLIHCRN